MYSITVVFLMNLLFSAANGIADSVVEAIQDTKHITVCCASSSYMYIIITYSSTCSLVVQRVVSTLNLLFQVVEV
jgi:hypothetical protein